MLKRRQTRRKLRTVDKLSSFIVSMVMGTSIWEHSLPSNRYATFYNILFSLFLPFFFSFIASFVSRSSSPIGLFSILLLFLFLFLFLFSLSLSLSLSSILFPNNWLNVCPNERETTWAPLAVWVDLRQLSLRPLMNEKCFWRPSSSIRL